MSDATVPAIALDHVGIASRDGSHDLTTLIGAALADGRAMPSGVTVARFGPAHSLELVWPNKPDSPVSGFLDRRGPGLHHVAFSVALPIEEARARLLAANLRVVGDVEPSSDGRPSIFVHPASTGGVLVELVEAAR